MSRINLNNITFTYYGDLLGVSDFYKISEREGYKKLDQFYNIIFNIFSRNISPETQIFIFSDSLFITGHHLQDTLNQLGNLYIELLKKQLYLKGAIVKGSLKFDPRIELDNITKKLPKGDVLFRAVTLEKHAVGIRLVIEKKLAQKILPQKLHGIPSSYLGVYSELNINENSILRKIRWTSDLNAYDYLWVDYGITGGYGAYQPGYWIENIKKGRLNANKQAQNHYTETIKFIKRFY